MCQPLRGEVCVYKATPIVGESTHRASADARIWLVSTSDEDAPGEPLPDATDPAAVGAHVRHHERYNQGR